jgi:hypothetical protein
MLDLSEANLNLIEIKRACGYPCKARKDDGNVIHTACADDIMTSNVQSSAKVMTTTLLRGFSRECPSSVSTILAAPK